MLIINVPLLSLDRRSVGFKLRSFLALNKGRAMINMQSIIVPQISTYPAPEARARKVLAWLTAQQIIAEQLSTCGSHGNRMAYAITEGIRQVMDIPQGVVADECLPFRRSVHGLEVVTQRCIFTPEQGFDKRARCPECRKQVGEVLLESLESWMPGETENFICPHCDHEDDINAFPFSQPCGFSNLGFIFNNCDGQYFKSSFLEEFAERLGRPISLVLVRQ
jgi:hypothetical protein